MHRIVTTVVVLIELARARRLRVTQRRRLERGLVALHARRVQFQAP